MHDPGAAVDGTWLAFTLRMKTCLEKETGIKSMLVNLTDKLVELPERFEG